MLDSSPRCRVCESRYTLFVQDVIGIRTNQKYTQTFCMDCRSFFHTSGYVEPAERLLADFEELFLQRENHSALQSQLALEIFTKRPHTRSVAEVGHGSGLFLKACEDYGRSAVGFEVNPHCHEFAVKELGVNSILGLFDDSHTEKYDLLAANQVFEHLETPRELFAVMVRHLRPDGSIYLGVPFLDRSGWPYLWTAGTDPAREPPDPFYDNDVHITHFSIEGMRRMGLSMGARSADYFVSQDVYQRSPGAYQGFLFTF
jgi:SAM-dependent methyltransferase